MKLKVFDTQGVACEEVDLPLPTFEGEKGMAALRDVVVAYRNNFRQGDAHAKNRSEVSGTGKKPYRQKGTGMARHGEKRSPIWSGGGVTFGPRKRDYEIKINKKVRRLALARSLFDRAQCNEITLITEFSFQKPSTKQFAQLLNKLGLGIQESALILDVDFEDNAMLSMRNLPQVYALDARSLNAWQSLFCNKVILTLRATNVLLSRLGYK